MEGDFVAWQNVAATFVTDSKSSKAIQVVRYDLTERCLPLQHKRLESSPRVILQFCYAIYWCIQIGIRWKGFWEELLSDGDFCDNAFNNIGA